MEDAERKLELTRYLRQEQNLNRMKVKNREDILYGTGKNSEMLYGDDGLELAEYDRIREQGHKGPLFGLRLAVSLMLFAGVIYLDKNQIADSFTFLGYDTNPYKYVARCDWFICPSFEEGFSTAATEALVVGTPVVTTLCSGMKEMLGENNEYGIIVENSSEGVYEGLKEVVSKPELLESYTKQAEIRGEKFSMQDTVDAVEDMLSELYTTKQNMN